MKGEGSRKHLPQFNIKKKIAIRILLTQRRIFSLGSPLPISGDW